MNEVFQMLEASGCFQMLGKMKSHEFVATLVDLSEHKYDCNRMEILEGIGERLGICGYCLKSARKFSEGMCAACRKGFPD